ncbi:MAG TPA: hypothetical protein VK348_04225 [Planctomycetota bacterium]|nr:hypothetical protein [Planctomycetota bacterium]
MSTPGVHRCVLLLLGCAACAGPHWHLDRPAAAQLFVDGRQEPGRELPFRYYGTSCIDVLPQAPAGKIDDFATVADRVEVVQPEPVTPWLYPFDLPLESLVRLFDRGDTDLAPRPAPNPSPVVTGFQPGGLEAMRTRARDARSQR